MDTRSTEKEKEKSLTSLFKLPNLRTWSLHRLSAFPTQRVILGMIMVPAQWSILQRVKALVGELLSAHLADKTGFMPRGFQCHDSFTLHCQFAAGAARSQEGVVVGLAVDFALVFDDRAVGWDGLIAGGAKKVFVVPDFAECVDGSALDGLVTEIQDNYTVFDEIQ
jgi:hypothetical protein